MTRFYRWWNFPFRWKSFLDRISCFGNKYMYACENASNYFWWNFLFWRETSLDGISYFCRKAMHAIHVFFLMKTSRFSRKVFFYEVSYFVMKVMHVMLWLMHVRMQMSGLILFSPKGQATLYIWVPMEIDFSLWKCWIKGYQWTPDFENDANVDWTFGLWKFQ